MATDPAIQKFIRERQDTLTPHFESGNIPEILKVYDEDLSFSDHAWHATDLSYSAFTQFLQSTYSTSSSLKMETHGVYGTKEFSVWEWTLRVVAGVDDPIRGLVKDKEIVLRGCSLHWWKQREGTSGEGIGDWRIVREGDYAVSAVPPGEGGGH